MMDCTCITLENFMLNGGCPEHDSREVYFEYKPGTDDTCPECGDYPCHIEKCTRAQRERNGPEPLLFSTFSEMNLLRHREWPRTNGGGEVKVTSQEWTISDWAVAIAEETGEICGKIKRLNRLRSGHIINRKEGSVDSEEEAILAIKKEIGDVCTYLDLLAQEGLGSTLEECLRLAYNGVSQRENLPHRI